MILYLKVIHLFLAGLDNKAAVRRGVYLNYRYPALASE